MENHPLPTLAIPLTLFMSILLATLTHTTSQQLRIPQFELANEACNIFTHTPPSSSHPVIPQDDDEDHHHHHHHHDHDDDAPPPPTPPQPVPPPPQPVPPPPPPPSPPSPAGQSTCCRRLMGIDNECVCRLMARLPRFIAKGNHTITIAPDQGCNVTYTCPGFP
ncbi:hypothetical protein QJS10_CPB12g00358 [Acorus calamus]|uniref:Bifunctional inhibitor/plant lipid transfer protein/seed storage helical domain-containing protein n=1 Tax=Acorus calamus TaxID=4465 RepID=A0AAV9DL50_ACOCL|nr:hypothetical protein QJS10_CPB12g00358 [Acorus calamus]